MSAPASRPLRVFLCHSSGDKPIVRELYQRLDSEGWIDAWLDEEKLYPGQDWNYEIELAVEAADVIIVCLTKNSVSKEGYIQRELRIILDLADYKPEGTLFIIPVRLEECEPPRRLRRWQYVDYFPQEAWDVAYGRLLTSLTNRAKALELAVQNDKHKSEGKIGVLEGSPKTQFTILVADNDHNFARQCKEMLEHEGYRVIPAYDSTEARMVLNRGDIDLAILDVRLMDDDDNQDYSGLVSARIPAYQKIPKILFAPSYAAMDYVRQALKDKTVRDVMFKYESPQSLIDAVARELTQRR